MVKAGKPPLSDLLTRQIPSLYDELQSCRAVAEVLGISEESVRKYAHILGAPIRKRRGMRRGSYHVGCRAGRRMDRDGYMLTSCPVDYRWSRKPHGKRLSSFALEHRLIAEIKLGRYLNPGEVIDHIDGIRFHNDPENLRVFDSNSAHLKETLSGKVPNWSHEGKAKTQLSRWRPIEASHKYPERIDTYSQSKKSGAQKMREILRARELLDNQSLWFLGTKPTFEKIGIPWPFDQKTEQNLIRKYYQILSAHPDIERWIRG